MTTTLTKNNITLYLTTTTMSNAQRQSMEDIALLQDGIDSLTAIHHSHSTTAAASQSHAEPALLPLPLLEEAGTIVTTGDSSNDNGNEYYHANDGFECDEDEEGFRSNAAGHFEISEVTINNNDGQHQHDQDSEDDPYESEDEEIMGRD